MCLFENKSENYIWVFPEENVIFEIQDEHTSRQKRPDWIQSRRPTDRLSGYAGRLLLTEGRRGHFRSKISLMKQLEQLRQVDIRSVNPDDLVEMDRVTIREDLPVGERLKDFIRQIGNPYCYRSHGVIVKISFSGRRSLEECILSCIEMESGSPFVGEDMMEEGRLIVG